MSDNEASKHYSEESFWQKVKKYALALGKEFVEKALWLYYAGLKESTPVWAKAVIVATLGYFIWPMDAIPDFTPVVGFADDLGALSTAVITLAAYIDDEVREKTAAKLRDWFGEDTDIEPAPE